MARGVEIGVRHVAAAVLAGALLLVPMACSTPAGAPGGASAAPAAPPTPGPDPSIRPYCDTVTRVQRELTAPGAGQRGLAGADSYRRQVAELAATAPPELAADWRTVQTLTDQALGALAATGGDPNRIDRNALVQLQQQAQPAIGRITQVTEQRCGITFSPPG